MLTPALDAARSIFNFSSLLSRIAMRLLFPVLGLRARVRPEDLGLRFFVGMNALLGRTHVCRWDLVSSCISTCSPLQRIVSKYERRDG